MISCVLLSKARHGAKLSAVTSHGEECKWKEMMCCERKTYVQNIAKNMQHESQHEGFVRRHFALPQSSISAACWPQVVPLCFSSLLRRLYVLQHGHAAASWSAPTLENDNIEKSAPITDPTWRFWGKAIMLFLLTCSILQPYLVVRLTQECWRINSLYYFSMARGLARRASRSSSAFWSLWEACVICDCSMVYLTRERTKGFYWYYEWFLHAWSIVMSIQSIPIPYQYNTRCQWPVTVPLLLNLLRISLLWNQMFPTWFTYYVGSSNRHSSGYNVGLTNFTKCVPSWFNALLWPWAVPSFAWHGALRWNASSHLHFWPWPLHKSPWDVDWLGRQQRMSVSSLRYHACEAILQLQNWTPLGFFEGQMRTNISKI